MAENAVKLGMSLDDIIERSNVRRTDSRNGSPTDMQIDRRNSGVRKPNPRSGSRADRQLQQRQKRSEKRCFAAGFAWIIHVCNAFCPLLGSVQALATLDAECHP